MKNKPIFVFAQWQVKTGCMEQVLNLLQQVATQSRAEPGNLNYQVFSDNVDSHKLLLFESYANQQALDAHRQSQHFQQTVLEQIVPLLENREVRLTTAMEF